MAGDDLTRFVRDALAQGVPRARVEEILAEAGWSRDQIRTALAAFADVEFQIPVPRPRPYLSAREVFVYLLLFGTFYLSAYNVGALLFAHVNRLFPDPVSPIQEIYARQLVRWSISSLAIAFPVFVALQRRMNREVARDPAKRRSQVRAALVHLTVFVAVCAVVGDLIALVYSALGGELTVRFVLKVLVIGAIAGTALLYYLPDLELEATKPAPADPSWRRRLAQAAVAVVAVVALTGLPIVGPPAAERARRLDERRVGDLRAVASAVNVYFTRHDRLPRSLAELSAEGGLDVRQRARETGPFEYRVTGERSYELCAVFEREAAARRLPADGDFWAHGVGRQCFPLTIEEHKDKP
jgi:hypothetical protein